MRIDNVIINFGKWEPNRGNKYGERTPTGDALSPFLFLIASEGLSVMVKTAASKGQFGGYKIDNSSLEITHLQFADDTLIIGEGTWKNVGAVKSLLQLFEVASGLKVNFFKSHLVGFNVEDSWLRVATMVLNCKSGSVPFKYLGLLIGVDQRKKRTWEPVPAKDKQRLGSWSNRCLSLGGRVTLLKSVLEAVPIYFFVYLFSWLHKV